MNDWVSFIETGHQHHVFSWLLLLQTWTAWHGTAAAAENALTANCCVIISGTAVMGLTSSTAASLVLACYCYYSQTTVSVLFFSHPLSEGWPHHWRTFSIYPCPLSFWLTSTESPVDVLMLSIQAVRGLPRLRAPGIVPCIISFSRQLPGFYASFLALTVSNSSLFTPALLRTHSFVFFAVHETYGIFLSPFISKTSRFVFSFYSITYQK